MVSRSIYPLFDTHTIIDEYKWHTLCGFIQFYIENSLIDFIADEFAKNSNKYAEFTFDSHMRLNNFILQYHHPESCIIDNMRFTKEWFIVNLRKWLKEHNMVYIFKDVKYWFRANKLKIFVVQQ
jgi:hypothetical protein